MSSLCFGHHKRPQAVFGGHARRVRISILSYRAEPCTVACGTLVASSPLAACRLSNMYDTHRTYHDLDHLLTYHICSVTRLCARAVLHHTDPTRPTCAQEPCRTDPSYSRQTWSTRCRSYITGIDLLRVIYRSSNRNLLRCAKVSNLSSVVKPKPAKHGFRLRLQVHGHAAQAGVPALVAKPRPDR